MSMLHIPIIHSFPLLYIMKFCKYTCLLIHPPVDGYLDAFYFVVTIGALLLEKTCIFFLMHVCKSFSREYNQEFNYCILELSQCSTLRDYVRLFFKVVIPIYITFGSVYC